MTVKIIDESENMTEKITNESEEISTLKMEVEALKECLAGIVYMAESGLHTKNEFAFARRIAEAKELCKR